jgi:DNA-binding winged helix-turn-helix (wHTH) protein
VLQPARAPGKEYNYSSDVKTVSKVFRFERNELDLDRYELRRARRRLPLSRMPMEFLILLVERRGNLVTRDEIAARVWTAPESVDIVQGINTAVNRIRAVLNDDAAKPRFIETVVGKGYRFIAPVEELEASPASTSMPEPEAQVEQIAEPLGVLAVPRTLNDLEDVRQTSRLPAWGKWLAVCLLFAGCLAAWYWKNRSIPRYEPEPLFRQITTLVPENRATAAGISPDGRLAVYANVDGIFIRRENGETTALSAPADFIVDRLAWFADATKLVASGFSTLTNVSSIWIVFVTGAPPRQFRTRAREGSPSPDGTRIVFISQDWSEIWLMGAIGEEPRRIVAGTANERFPLVFWSPDGRRLAFQRHQYKGPSESRSYESVVPTTGKVVSRGEDLGMSSAAALPDGRVAFLRWDNNDFSSSRQLWEVKTDLATGALLGKPRKIAALAGDNTTLLALSVTADGKRAMVLRRYDQNSIFVGDFDPSTARIANVRRLTLDERTNYPHAWTADSRAVIFESDRNGHYDLFKQDIHRRTPETIVATPADEVLPQLTPDGRFILYAGQPHETQQPWNYQPRAYRLMRVPVEGGTPEPVDIGGPLDEFRCALGAGKRCVLRTTAPGVSRTYYDLDPFRGKGRELARTKWSSEVRGDWDISPDGTRVAIPNHDSRDARIRVVALDSSPRQPREHEVVLPGVTDLRGLVWAADGKSWFVSVDTTAGNRTLYAHPDGRFQSLGDIQGWAVPSPDGRKVAFLNRIIATNAWMIRLH